jgi:hypothetical protein
MYWKEIYKTIDLDPKQFSQSTNRQTQWVRRAIAIGILRRTQQNRSELYKRFVEGGGDRGQKDRQTTPIKQRSWESSSSTYRTRQVCNRCWGFELPTLWLVELLNWSCWPWSADSFTKLYTPLFTSFKTFAIVLSRVDLYLFIFTFADTWLCKAPCFLSCFWVF